MLATAAAGLELDPGDRLLAGSSLSHVGAFYVSFGALSVGACTVVARSFDGDELLPLLREGRPTVLSMLPSALFALTRDHGARSRRLRLAAALPGRRRLRVGRAGARVHGADRPGDRRGVRAHRGRAGVGQPAVRGDSRGLAGQIGPAVTVEIRNDDGHEVAPGEQGRLWIHTPSATVGYWDNQDATEAVFRDGWLDSGDVMRADDDEYLFFCGRNKQIIVHDGSNITPQVVEGALLEHPMRRERGGGRDPRPGPRRERARLRHAARGAARPANQELIQFARERVGTRRPGDRGARRDAAHGQRQGRPDAAQAMATLTAASVVDAGAGVPRSRRRPQPLPSLTTWNASSSTPAEMERLQAELAELEGPKRRRDRRGDRGRPRPWRPVGKLRVPRRQERAGTARTPDHDPARPRSRRPSSSTRPRADDEIGIGSRVVVESDSGDRSEVTSRTPAARTLSRRSRRWGARCTAPPAGGSGEGQRPRGDLDGPRHLRVLTGGAGPSRFSHVSSVSSTSSGPVRSMTVPSTRLGGRRRRRRRARGPAPRAASSPALTLDLSKRKPRSAATARPRP